MTIELTPNGVACNLSCPYCYQEPMRDAGNISRGYDMKLMKEGLLREGGSFALFGGEPLLLPLEDMEEIFIFGLNNWGSNGVQTNGTLITDRHIALFKQYRVQVGISVDGPDELNDSRWAGSLDETRAATAKSMSAINRLCSAGMPPSLIVTLYRGNAIGERLTRLLDWFATIELQGVRHVRLHLLEVETSNIQKMALTIEENVIALQRLYAFQKTTAIQFDLFGEMAQLLLGNDRQTTCIWNACDPYTTSAVRGVGGHGESLNCGRVNKEGIDWEKASTPGHERQVGLYTTPQSEGGCQDCRFFFACKGNCPGTAIDNDWRNRSEHCEIWMRMFEQIEGDLRGLGQKPVSLEPWRPAMERLMVSEWAAGNSPSIYGSMQRILQQQTPCGPTPCPEGDHPHGDHWDAPDGTQHNDGAYIIHGDGGRTEMHGDSNNV